MALRIALLTCVLLVGSTPAWSQDQIKKNLFDDCEAAKREFSQLTPEQRQPLLEFFTRVIGLSTQSPSAPEAFAVIPGAPKGADVGHHAGGKAPDVAGAFLQTTDARRELRGKRCALDLLQTAEAEAISILPTLVKVYSEQPLSDEIAVHLEETSALIAERAHKQGLGPSLQQFDEIIPHISGPRPLAAQNALQEFLALAMPRIVQFAAAHSDTECKALMDFLRVVDGDGSRAFRSFIDLVPTLDESQSRRLSEILPLPSSPALAQFVPDLIRLSMTSERTPVFLPVLARICVSSGGLKIDSALDARVSQIPIETSLKSLPVEQAACLINSSAVIGRSYAQLLSDTQHAQTVEFALSILPLIQKSLSAEARTQISSRLKEMALAPTIPIAAQATASLRFFPERRSESLVVAAQNNKRGFELKDPTQRDQLVQASFALVTSVGAQRDGAKFTPSVLRAIESNVARAEAEALAAQIPDIEGRLIAIVRGQNNAGARAAALRALSNRASLSKQFLPAIADLLSQDEFQSIAARALARGGSASSSILRRITARGGESARHGALAALALSGAISKQEIAELLGSMQGEDCAHIEDDVDILCAAPIIKSDDPGDREKISSVMNRCAASLSSPRLKRLVECHPTSILNARAALIASSKDATLLESFSPIINQLVASAPSPERDATLVALLNEASDPIRERLFKVLLGKRDLSNELLAGLRSFANSTGLRSPTTYFAALRVLASIGDSQFGWQAFLQEGVALVGRGEHRKEILSLIPLLPAELVLQVVVPNLDRDEPDRLVGASLVGAALGTKAVPIVSKVWHLREKRAPAVRYTSILALLQINPLTPDISDYVERVLVNRYYPLAQELPINWAQTVAVADLDKSMFGTLRTVRLEQLLTAAPQR